MIKTDNKWDQTADVIVIGYGLAGTAAAITARENGAEVLVLEKSKQDNFHSNSSMAGLAVMGSNDIKQTIGHLDLLNRISGDTPWTEPEIIHSMAGHLVDSPAWLQKLGGNISFFSKGAEHIELPGADSLEGWSYAGMGFKLMELLHAKTKQLGITVAFDTAAKRLLTNLRGEITGVRVKTGEINQKDIRAIRGVILACGGFEFDERMKLNYLKVYPAFFTGTENNTGDGIRMAQDVGADLWHMNCVSARLVVKFPEMPWAIPVNLGGKGWTRRMMYNFVNTGQEPSGYIMVDRNCQRYTNENFKGHSVYYELGLFDTHQLSYPRVPSYWIFDQKRMEEGRLTNDMGGATGPHQLYHWSSDNGSEIEKGWIVTDRSMRGLALKLSISPEALEKTIGSYNRYCEQAQDPDFGRQPSTLTPLDKPPFYACRLWPGGPNTQGGPRRNVRSQVVNIDGEPIQHLYGAGELGSIFGMLYPIGGANLSECIASGRIAGENAAREKPI